MIDLDITKLKLPNGRTAEQQLLEEGRRFKACLDEELTAFYGSYSPSMYGRTGGLRNSVGMPEVSTGGGAIIVTVRSTGSEYHASLYGGEANTMKLMNEGYKTVKPPFRDVPYFGYRGGYNFLENAYAKWQAGCYFNVSVKVVTLPF